MRQERKDYGYHQYSNEWLIDRYLKYGSVEEALYTGDSVPFSFAEYHRRLEKAGIVKSAGRQTNLLEALHFFHLKTMQPGMPLEKLYTKMPESFQTSVATLHRIYNRVKEQSAVRRAGTALVISEGQNKNSVLVGEELFGNGEYGKIAGRYTIPMTFSLPSETPLRSIVRVLQQEVLSHEAVVGKFTDPTYVEHLLSDVRQSFLTYRLLDIDIHCYSLAIPEDICHFTSHKLSNHHFVSLNEIMNASDYSEYRTGVRDIVSEYETTFEFSEKYSGEIISPLNVAIAEAS